MAEKQLPFIEKLIWKRGLISAPRTNLSRYLDNTQYHKHKIYIGGQWYHKIYIAYANIW